MEIDSGPGPDQRKPRSRYELGVDGLVGKTISLWMRQLPKYILIVGITGVVLTIIQAVALIAMFGLLGLGLLNFIGTSPIDSVLSLFLTEEPFTAYILLVVFVLSIISLIVYAIIAGAATKFALTDYENPGTGNIGESFSFAISRTSTLIGTQLLQSFIIIGLAVVTLLIYYIDPIIFLVMILLVIYLAVRLMPASAVVIAEDHTPFTAIGRSWQITQRFFWHVFLGQILMAIVVIIIDLIIGIVVGIILIGFIPSIDLTVLIATVISSLVLSPLNYIYLAVLYKDLEARGTSRGYAMWQ